MLHKKVTCDLCGAQCTDTKQSAHRQSDLVSAYRLRLEFLPASDCAPTHREMDLCFACYAHVNQETQPI
jgi:hypothetical protein